MSNKYLLWDFDGVITDSMEECLLVSYNALISLTDKKSLDKIDRVEQIPKEIQYEFKRTRGYVRLAGEYFILFQAILDNNPINSWADFNNYLAKYGEIIPKFNNLFYVARKKLRFADPKYWNSLHNIYPWVRKSWECLGGYFDFFVVSNKDAESIKLVMEHGEIPLEGSKIFGKEFSLSKKEIVAHILKSTHGNKHNFLFIDDNYYHLLDVAETGVRLYFATWGYGKIEGKVDSRIELLYPNTFTERITSNHDREIC